MENIFNIFHPRDHRNAPNSPERLLLTEGAPPRNFWKTVFFNPWGPNSPERILLTEGPPPRYFWKIIFLNIFFYPWGPPECTKEPRNPTNRGGPLETFLENLNFYPCGPNSPERILLTEGPPPRDFLENNLYLFNPGHHRNAPKSPYESY